MKENCKNQQEKNKERQKAARETEPTVKGWQLNDFVRLSPVNSKSSLIFKSKLMNIILINLTFI